jgi:type I protein arginine methyltransferase
MYSMEMFARMFTGQERHDAFMEALRRTVKPGDVVIDIGTGIGIYAMVAAKLGARKVYALEPNPLVRLGPELAKRNGFAEGHIDFFEVLSTDFEPAEQADVIFSDIRGCSPLLNGVVATLFDAAARLLKPGGVMISQQDTIYAALIKEPRQRGSLWSNWRDNPFGFDLGPAMEAQFAEVQGYATRHEDLLTAPHVVGEVVFGVQSKVDLRAEWTTDALADGEVHGVATWFDALLLKDSTDGDVRLSCGPERRPSIYPGGVFCFVEPLQVSQGDRLRVRFSGVDVGHLTWAWSVSRMVGDRAVETRSGSSFAGAPLTARTLALGKEDRVISASVDLLIDSRVLPLFASGSSVGDVVDVLLAEFPDRFADRASARSRAIQLADRYGQRGQV